MKRQFYECGICGGGEGFGLDRARNYPLCTGCGYGICKSCRSANSTKTRLECILCDLEQSVAQSDLRQANLENKETKFIVIGACMTGLTTALSLAKRGFKVDVYERRPDNGSLVTWDAMINIVFTTLRGFQDLEPDFVERISSLTKNSCEFPFANEKAKYLIDVDFEGIAKAYHLPTKFLNCNRNALLENLKLFLPKDKVRIYYGKNVTSVRQQKNMEDDSTKVHVEFEDGSEAMADFLVGADGINSFVRKSIFGKVNGTKEPNYVCDNIRGEVKNMPNIADFKEQYNLPTYEGEGYLLGKAGSFISFRMKNETSFEWALGHSNRKLQTMCTKENFNEEEILAEIQHQLKSKGYHQYALDLVKSTTPGSLACFPLRDLPKQKKYHLGNIVLAGDAAHAMQNALGIGGCTGMEDGIILGETVDMFCQVYGESQETVRRALKFYEQRRKGRAQRLAFLSKQISIFINVRVSQPFRFIVHSTLKHIEKRNRNPLNRIPIFDFYFTHRVVSAQNLVLEDEQCL